MTDPIITIGGQTFTVPPLTLGQIKVVVPTATRLRGIDLENITAAQIEDLTEIAYQGALKGKPDLRREDFTALPGTLNDLLKAFAVVALQAGMEFRQDNQPGEAPASP